MSAPLWLRLSLWLVLLLGGAWAGWTIESWREGAARAATLEADLSRERAQRTTSEAARARLAAELAQRSAEVQTQIKEVIKYVPRLIPDRRECDFDVAVVGLLNRARGYGVPGAGRPTAVAAGAAAATP